MKRNEIIEERNRLEKQLLDYELSYVQEVVEHIKKIEGYDENKKYTIIKFSQLIGKPLAPRCYNSAQQIQQILNGATDRTKFNMLNQIIDTLKAGSYPIQRQETIEYLKSL